MLLCLPVVVGVGGHLISPSSSVALLLLSINMLNSIASIARHQHKPQFPSFCLPPSAFRFLPFHTVGALPRFSLTYYLNPILVFFSLCLSLHMHAFFIGGPSCCLPALVVVVEQEGRGWRTAMPTHRRRRPWEKRYSDSVSLP